MGACLWCLALYIQYVFLKIPVYFSQNLCSSALLTNLQEATPTAQRSVGICPRYSSSFSFCRFEFFPLVTLTGWRSNLHLSKLRMVYRPGHLLIGDSNNAMRLGQGRVHSNIGRKRNRPQSITDSIPTRSKSVPTMPSSLILEEPKTYSTTTAVPCVLWFSPWASPVHGPGRQRLLLMIETRNSTSSRTKVYQAKRAQLPPKNFKVIEANTASLGSADPDNFSSAKPTLEASNPKAQPPTSQRKGSKISKQGPQDEPQSEENSQDGEEYEDEEHDQSSSAPTPPEDDAKGEHVEAPVKIEEAKNVSVSGLSYESA